MEGKNDEESNQYDLTFKIIVIGDPGVGKSCLTGRAVKDIFDEKYVITLGFEFLTYTINIEDKVIKLQIWDTCGQEQYKSLISNFYRNASLAMIVYSIDSRDSFIHVNTWLKDVKLQSHPDVKIILIGNKSDLESNRQVSTDEARKYKEENQLLYFSETSAKTGLNAKEAFTAAARILFKEHLNYKTRAQNNLSFSDSSYISYNTVPKKLVKWPKRSGNCC